MCPDGRSVYVTHSVGNDSVWSTPMVLPSADGRPAHVSGNDISSIVHFGNKIGVMYSDQVADPITPTQTVTNHTGDYFAYHVDGQPDTSWTSETALVGKRRVGRPHQPQGGARRDVVRRGQDVGERRGHAGCEDPLIYLLKRSTAGVWTKTTFATVATQDTRSQILLDPANNAVYQFATYPPSGAYEAGGWIYCKVTSMSSPSFASGIGDPFIQLSDGDHLNNFSTTKQTVGPASGLLGIAADDANLHYAHNSLSMTGTPSCLGAAVVPPVVPVPPPPVVTPPVVKPPVVTPPVVTPLVVTPPVVTPLVVTPPVVPASTPCRVISSSVKVRSLSSLLSALRKTSTVRLKVKTTCSVRLKLAASLGKRRRRPRTGERVPQEGHEQDDPGAPDAHRARPDRAQGQRQDLRDHPTPAVKGLSPARTWSTTIAFHS